MTTHTNEYGEYPALDSFTHTEGPLVVPLLKEDLTPAARQKLVAALEAHGIDIDYVTGVIVSGVEVYELDKSGHYVQKDGKLAKRIVPL